MSVFLTGTGYGAGAGRQGDAMKRSDNSDREYKLLITIDAEEFEKQWWTRSVGSADGTGYQQQSIWGDIMKRIDGSYAFSKVTEPSEMWTASPVSRT